MIEGTLSELGVGVGDTIHGLDQRRSLYGRPMIEGTLGLTLGFNLRFEPKVLL
jgi:hypothetical protein